MSLHECARRGDLAGLRRELATGVAIDAREPGTGDTALLAAAASGAGAELTALLLDHGADVNAVSEERGGKSALLLAVTAWDVGVLGVLVDAGADLSCRSRGGYDVLTSAFFREGARTDPRLCETLSFLIRRGAALDMESDYGESAMSVASRLGRWDVCALLLSSGADAAGLGWTELHRRVALGTPAEVEDALGTGTGTGELEARDSWERTPWLLSLQVGAVDKIEALVQAGADPKARGRCGKHPYLYAVESGELPALAWLIRAGFDVEEGDDFEGRALTLAASEGAASMVEALLGAGAELERKDGADSCAMSEAGTLEVVRCLQAAGGDVAKLSEDMRAALTGLERRSLECTKEAFAEGWARRFGRQNPEPMDIAFWRAMVSAGVQAFAARQDAGAGVKVDAAVWCYARYGQSITELGDGRVLEVGGEHEDHYDPDFCIYNDVIVHDGQGAFTIYGYPREVFPPTDFHTATLFEGWVYLIGSVGYAEERELGRAQVLRLSTRDFRVERVETTGEDPGWISGHRAHLQGSGEVRISGGKVCTEADYVDREGDFALDLRTHAWRRVPNRERD